MRKKLIGIGLALLLAGCGSATSTAPTAVTSDTGIEATVPAGTDGSTSSDTPATSMPSTDATMQPTSAASDSAPTSMPSTDATVQPTSAAPAAGPVTSVDPATVTQDADIPELGVAFKVPAGWEQVSGQNAWAPAGAQSPQIVINAVKLSNDWRPSSMLPEGARVTSSEVQTLSSGQINLYTIENSDGTAEIHAIRPSGDTAYDIYARAASMEEVKTFQPVLNTVIDSFQLGSG